MIDKGKLNNLYKIYNFEIDNSESQIGVFIYKKSRYHGVDIVPLNDQPATIARAEQIKKSYSDSGFATELKFVKEVNEVEEELYKSFFTYDATKLRLKAKYRKFVENQL